MMNKHLCLLLLISLPVLNQAQNSAFGYRTSLAVQKDLKHGFEAEFGLQYRLNQTTLFSKYYLSGELQKKLHKRWSTFAEYRYSTSSRQNQHRFGLSLNYSKKIKRVSLHNTFKFQNTSSFLYPIQDYENSYQNTFRNKLQVRYHIQKHLFLYISAEPFFMLNPALSYDKIRGIGGLNIDLGKKSNVDLGFLYQKSTSGNVLNNICLKYTWKMPKKKTKKEVNISE